MHVLSSSHWGIPGSLAISTRRYRSERRRSPAACMSIAIGASVRVFVSSYFSVSVVGVSVVRASALCNPSFEAPPFGGRRRRQAEALYSASLAENASYGWHCRATQLESDETCQTHALHTLSAVRCPCLRLSVAASVCPSVYHSLCFSKGRL